MKSESSFDAIMRIGEGHAAFQLLWAGCEFKLFSILQEHVDGLTLAQVSQKVGLKPYPTRILLEGLCALELITKKNDVFMNTHVASKHLVESSPENMIGIFGWQYHIVYKGLIDFVDALKQCENIGLRHFPGVGNTLYERLSSHQELEKIFHDAMSCLSKLSNQALIKSHVFSKLYHVIDVGGGDGTNAIALAKQHPHIEITIFDSSTVCALAKENVQRHGLSDRIKFVVGNAFKDPLPKNADAFLFVHMFTIWSGAKSVELLQKVHRILQPGGKVLVYNMVGSDLGDSGPISTALGSPYFLTIATGEGMLYGGLDYESWFHEAGFKAFSRLSDFPIHHSLFVGTK